MTQTTESTDTATTTAEELAARQQARDDEIREALPTIVGLARRNAAPEAGDAEAVEHVLELLGRPRKFYTDLVAFVSRADELAAEAARLPDLEAEASRKTTASLAAHDALKRAEKAWRDAGHEATVASSNVTSAIRAKNELAGLKKRRLFKDDDRFSIRDLLEN